MKPYWQRLLEEQQGNKAAPSAQRTKPYWEQLLDEQAQEEFEQQGTELVVGGALQPRVAPVAPPEEVTDDQYSTALTDRFMSAFDRMAGGAAQYVSEMRTVDFIDPLRLGRAALAGPAAVSGFVADKLGIADPTQQAANILDRVPNPVAAAGSAAGLGTAGQELYARGARANAENQQLTLQRPENILDDLGASARYFGQEAAVGSGATLAALALGRLSPSLGAAAMAAGAGGEEYGQRRAEGQDVAQASQGAAFTAAVEAGTELLPFASAFGKLAKTFGEPAAKRVADLVAKVDNTRLGRVAGTAAAEGATEVINEAANILYETGVDGEAITFDDAFRRLTDSGIIGSLTGTAMGGIGAIAAPPKKEETKKPLPKTGDPIVDTTIEQANAVADRIRDSVIGTRQGDLFNDIEGEGLIGDLFNADRVTTGTEAETARARSVAALQPEEISLRAEGRDLVGTVFSRPQTTDAAAQAAAIAQREATQPRNLAQQIARADSDRIVEQRRRAVEEAPVAEQESVFPAEGGDLFGTAATRPEPAPVRTRAEAGQLGADPFGTTPPASTQVAPETMKLVSDVVGDKLKGQEKAAKAAETKKRNLTISNLLNTVQQEMPQATPEQIKLEVARRYEASLPKPEVAQVETRPFKTRGELGLSGTSPFGTPAVKSTAPTPTTAPAVTPTGQAAPDAVETEDLDAPSGVTVGELRSRMSGTKPLVDEWASYIDRVKTQTPKQKQTLRATFSKVTDGAKGVELLERTVPSDGDGVAQRLIGVLKKSPGALKTKVRVVTGQQMIQEAGVKSLGLYRHDTNEILLLDSEGEKFHGLDTMVLGHEMFHGATSKAVQSEIDARAQGRRGSNLTISKGFDQLESARSDISKWFAKNKNSLTPPQAAAVEDAIKNSKELIAYVYTDKDLRQLLRENIPAKTGILQKIKQAIARLLNMDIKNPETKTIVDQILDTADRIAEVQASAEFQQNASSTTQDQMAVPNLNAQPAKPEEKISDPVRRTLRGKDQKATDATPNWKDKLHVVSRTGAVPSDNKLMAALKDVATFKIQGDSGSTIGELILSGANLLTVGGGKTRYMSEAIDWGNGQVSAMIASVLQPALNRIDAKLNKLGDKFDRSKLSVELAAIEEGIQNSTGPELEIWKDMRTLRRELDDMSMRIFDLYLANRKDTEVLTKRELKVLTSIQENIGRYTHRAYMAAINRENIGSKWASNLLANREADNELGEIYRNAKDHVVNNLIGFPEKWSSWKVDKLRDMYKAWTNQDGSVLNRDQLIDRLSQKYEDLRNSDIGISQQIDNLADDLLKGMLQLNTKQPSVLRDMYRLSEGTYDKTLLMDREKVPEPIRKFLGEITDPVVVVANTLRQMVSLHSKLEFLKNSYDKGTAEGWLLTAAQRNELPEDQREMYSNTFEGETFGALRGMYTTYSNYISIESKVKADDANALALSVYSPENVVAHGITWGINNVAAPLASLAKISSVVFSTGNMLLQLGGSWNNVVMNGNLSGKSYAKGFKVAKQLILASRRKDISPETTEAYMTQIVDSALAGEIKADEQNTVLEMLTDMVADLRPEDRSKLRKFYDFTLTRRGGVAKAIGLIKEGTIDTYAVMDMWSKIANYYAEKKALEAYYNRHDIKYTEVSLRQNAAERIKRTNLSYHRTIGALKATERTGLTMFGVYFFETYRAWAANVLEGLKDIHTGVKMKDPAWTAHGAKRVAGAGAALYSTLGLQKAYYGAVGALGIAGAQALGEGLSAVFGDDEEEKLVQRALGEMYDGKVLVYVGRTSEGYPYFTELSRLDPNDPVAAPVRLAMEGDLQGAQDAFLGMAFMNTQIKNLYQAISSSVTGKPVRTSTESAYPELYQDMRAGLMKAVEGDSADRVIRATEALVPRQIKDMYEAFATQEEGAYQNLFGIGIRPIVFDPEVQLERAWGKYNGDLVNKMKADLKADLDMNEQRSEDYLRDKFMEYFREEQRQFSRLADTIKAADYIVESPDKVKQMAVDAGVPHAVIRRARNDVFQSRVATEELMDSVYDEMVKEGADPKEADAYLDRVWSSFLKFEKEFNDARRQPQETK